MVRLDRIHIRGFLFIVASFWGLVLLCQGTVIGRDYFQPFSIVSTILIVVLAAHNRFLWRCRLFHGWFVKRPDLRGTWLVNMQSDWINPETKQGIPPITSYMGVKQTLSYLQMYLMTPESESWLIVDQIDPARSGEGYRIIGIYNNEPKIDLRGDRSEIHYGGIRLHSHGPEHRPDTLTGEYWTDRKTAGRMTFSRRHPTVFTRFKDADQAFTSR